MRSFLFGVSCTLVSIQAGFAACPDTTLVIAAGAPGYNATTGVYTPSAANAINNVINNCTSEASITVRLKFADAARGDTLRLAGEITVSNRSGKTTRIVGKGNTDSVLTLLENSVTDPQLIQVNSSNTTFLDSLGFARKSIGTSSPGGNGTASVVLSATGSKVTKCHFWMLDNSSTGTGALLDILADSVLVERCLFRAPPDGAGRSIALHTGASATKVEIRSNVFFSTGAFLAASGSVHVIANTFAGSRDAANPILIANTVSAPGTNVVIMHNLFANKVDTLPPIAFAATLAGSDSILRNAWSRGKAGLPLAVSASTSPLSISLPKATGSDVNTPLPRGFSNYGLSSSQLKDYPLTQLHSDPTLARKHADFGKYFRVFTTTNWTGMADIKDLSASRLYFPNFSASSFLGKAWLANVKVGAFVDQDGYETPSPLDSGARGDALNFALFGDGTKIKLSERDFDESYYQTLVTPQTLYYFFSDTLANLASNDSAALKTSTRNALVRKDYLGDDSILTVPPEVRNEGKDIFVKLLHYRQGFQAPVRSAAVIAQVSNVPSFPINDLTLTVEASTNFATGKAVIKVTRGTEAIDSVRVVAATAAGQEVGRVQLPASGSSVTFNIDMPKGSFVFYAVPLAKLGSVTKAGQPTASTVAYAFQVTKSDSLYVSYQSGACSNADGSQTTPYCSMDAAVKKIDSTGGTTIIVLKQSLVMDTVTIASSGTTPLTITTLLVTNKYEVSRPIFRGNAKEALTITRKNVTVKGFFIEMPIGSTNTALTVKGSGALIEGNIFRASAEGAVDGVAINIDVGDAGEARVVNNVVWAFSKNIQITNTASANVRVLNNTLVEEAVLNPGKGTGIFLAGTGALSAVFANNFFSGISNPIDVGLTGKTPVLVNNVFTRKPDLHNLDETGYDTSSVRIKATNIWGDASISNLENGLAEAIECSSLKPCNALYAGSSSNTYNTNINLDVLGKPRTNKKEVGAYERDPGPSSPLGILDLELTTVESNYQRINFMVAGRTFDPAPGEADSVHVWWSPSRLGLNIDPSLATIPAIRRKHFPISKLGAGNFSDFADSILLEGKTYFFYAALGKTTIQNGVADRKLGYAYSDTIVSNFNKTTEDCNFTKSNSVCPSEGGVFIPNNPVFAGFQTQVNMAEPVTSGLFKNPEFEAVSSPLQYDLDLRSSLPIIRFSTAITDLGRPGSSQMFTASISIEGDVSLTGKDLFLLPADSGGMASLVTTWSTTQTQANGRTVITIESSRDGEQRYAFGTMALPGGNIQNYEPGIILSTDATPQVFDFASLKGANSLQIPVKFKGTGFKTANPLVLISLVPAGGIAKNVLSEIYHSKTVLLTSGFSGLKDSLANDRFHKYYQRAVGAEPVSTVLPGQRKPFVLDSLAEEDLLAVSRLDTQDVKAVGGEIQETTVLLTIASNFKKENKAIYSDASQKTTRSLEVEYTVFDGAKISRSRAFIRTKFTQPDVQITERGVDEGKGFPASSASKPRWNLFGYPWEEADEDNLTRMMAATKWDPEKYRLMQYKGSGAGLAAFNAYDGSNAKTFAIDSGHAMWSGAVHEYNPISAGGMSLDYQTLSLSLKPRQWNDFSLPFSFPIVWKDILDSSSIANEADVEIWRYNPDAQDWSKVTKDSVLKPWQGFTIRPKVDDITTLKFPILDSTRSLAKTAPVAAAKAGARDEGDWIARVVAFNRTAAMTLWIGKGGRGDAYPEAPDVPGQDFRVALQRGTPAGVENLSTFIQAQDGDWQGHWALRTDAQSGSEGISLRLPDARQDLPVYLVDALHKTATPLSADAAIQVSGEEMRANEYHVVAGDAAYLDQVMKGVVPLHLLALSNYPNPFAASTLIRYALPESFGKVTFDLKVRDFRGRTVWETTIRGPSALSYLWDGRDRMNVPLPAGVYTLSLEASAVGKAKFRANRRMLRM